MVNGVNNTTGISSYPQSFQDLIQKPQNSAPQGAQPTAAEGDKVNISKKSKGKKIAAGIGIAAAAVLALSTALHKLQPQIFTDMLAKEGFGGTIARGIDNVGKFISDIPGKISKLFHKNAEQQDINQPKIKQPDMTQQQETQEILGDFEKAFGDPEQP